MIVRLNKAVLHVLDLDSAVSVLSKAELDLDEKPVKSYVQSICRKALGSTDCRHGNFGTDNALATKVSRCLHGADEFVPLTAEMAGFVFGEIQRADGAKSTDMLVADFMDGDDTRYLGLFLLEGKKAFVHDVSQAGSMVSCDIVRRYGVLPAATPEARELGHRARGQPRDLLRGQTPFHRRPGCARASGGAAPVQLRGPARARPSTA